MIRNAIKNTANRGSIIYGTVEECTNGSASIRLSTNGARLSGLSTLGAQLDIGDRVIIDYSGNTPYVRPIYKEEAVVENSNRSLRTRQASSESTEVSDPLLGPSGDYSCGAIMSNYGELYDSNGAHFRVIQSGQWYNHDFGNYLWDVGDQGPYVVWEQWDSCNMMDGDHWLSPNNFITIPEDGKYLIIFHGGIDPMCWPIPYFDDPYSLHTAQENTNIYLAIGRAGSHTHLRIRKNGTIVAETTLTALTGVRHDGWHFQHNHVMHIKTILVCSAGDKLSTEYMIDWIDYRQGWSTADDRVGQIFVWRFPYTTVETRTTTYTNPYGNTNPTDPDGNPLPPGPGIPPTLGRHAHVRSWGDGLHYHKAYLYGQEARKSNQPAFLKQVEYYDLSSIPAFLLGVPNLPAYTFGTTDILSNSSCDAYLSGYLGYPALYDDAGQILYDDADQVLEDQTIDYVIDPGVPAYLYGYAHDLSSIHCFISGGGSILTDADGSQITDANGHIIVEG